MPDADPPFIKINENEIINLNAIKWVIKMNDCLHICTKSVGCHERNNDTHILCKSDYLDGYNKLDRKFW